MATWMDVRMTEDQLKGILKAVRRYLKDYQHKGAHSGSGRYVPVITDTERVALEFFIEIYKRHESEEND